MNKKIVGMLVLLTVAAGLIAGSAVRWLFPMRAAEAQTTTLSAQTFRLVDSSGAVRGALAWSPGTGSALVLTDQAGTPRLTFGINPGGNSPILTLDDQNGTQRVELSLTPDGSPRLILIDPSGQTRIGMRVTADGPDLAAFDANGNVIYSLSGLIGAGAAGAGQSNTAANTARLGDFAGQINALPSQTTDLWDQLKSNHLAP